MTTGSRSRAASSRTQYSGHGALYGRTTGIWQTVWLEPLPETYLQRARITPDVANGVFRLAQPLNGPRRHGMTLRATVRDEHGAISSISCAADADFAPQLDLPIPAERRRLWSIADPFLYDLEIELLDGGTVIDTVASYAGLRGVTIDGKAIKLNGQVIFQRLVLDQGYYPDGIMTAPSDEALIRDIQLSMDAGFNGARLHQKVFEERFLYHADRMGYIVWGEFPDWGCSRFGPTRGSPAARPELHHRMAGGDRARLFAPQHRRLVPAERDLAAAERPHHRAG